MKTGDGGRLASWSGFLFGSVMSVAANVLHAWLPAATMPPGWYPSVASQIGAAVWPIGLLISVEVLSRVQWPDGPAWLFARYGGAGTVALGSGVISYGHLSGVLDAWQYGWVGSHVGPLVLDGLMVVSGFALMAIGDGTSRAVGEEESRDVPEDGEGEAERYVPRDGARDDLQDDSETVGGRTVADLVTSQRDVPRDGSELNGSASHAIPQRPANTSRQSSRQAPSGTSREDRTRAAELRRVITSSGTVPTPYAVRKRFGCNQATATRLIELATSQRPLVAAS